MKAKENPSPDEQSASEQIDAIISKPGDWRGEKLSHLRAVITKADPAVVEEVKWKKPSKPEGRQLSQDSSFSGNAVRQHHVEC